MLTMLKSKIHRAAVTEANLDYEGSITIDSALMEAASILPYEQVDVLNINNGSRFTTYAITGEKDSGVICINGAAARLAQKNDLVIICTYQKMDEEHAKKHNPKIILVDAKNKVK